MKIKTAIAEDNQNLTRTLLEGLAGFDELEVVFTAYNGANMLEKLAKLSEEKRPDLILMDIEMPEMNGIEATRQITDLYPSIKILMLTVFDQEDKIFDSILAGASGYLLKDEPAAKIVAAIHDTLSGGAAMSAPIAARALKLLRTGKPETHAAQQDEELTRREMEILELLAQGLSHTKIAEKCFISPGTVRKHIENIYTKLHVHNKIEAVQVAGKKKWFNSNMLGII